MHSLRRRLIGLAAALLTSQLAAMTAAPVLLYRSAAAATIDGHDVLCACKDEPGAECPMHAGKKQSSGQESGTWRSCAGFGDRAAVLTWLTSSAGIVETSAHAIVPAASSVVLRPLNAPILNADGPPTSPPPRS